LFLLIIARAPTAIKALRARRAAVIIHTQTVLSADALEGSRSCIRSEVNQIIRLAAKPLIEPLGNLPLTANVINGMSFENFVEEIQVLGRDLVDKVRELIHEGNVQRIVVKDEHGNTFLEIPVTVAAVGVILAPLLAAIGAISALVAKFSIVVVRSEPKPPEGGKAAS
jgi:hypothetical protein